MAKSLSSQTTNSVTMVQPDKRLLWHPRHENKFVVGGNSQITLYEWASEFPKIRHVTSQHDLQFMKVRVSHGEENGQDAGARELEDKPLKD